MTHRDRPVVGLWAHRLQDLHRRTGVGRYALELSRALHALDQPSRPVTYCFRTGREHGGASSEIGLDVGRSWPPRRALHLAWTTMRWPRYEQVGPAADVLHVLFPAFPVPTRAKLVGTVHDLFPLTHPEWYPRSERWSVGRSIQALAHDARRIICDSDLVREQVVECLGVERERTAVIHCGIGGGWSRDPWAESRREAARDGRRPYVIAVGSVEARKNLVVALQALRRLPELDLVLAGPQTASSGSTLEAVARLGLSDRVRVTGRVPDGELIDLVQGAEVLVHPSKDEGFGFPPLEAMAAGTPAVVSGAGSLPEVVGDGGSVVRSDDPDDWAEAISALTSDADRRSAAVVAGRSHAATFTWLRAAELTREVHLEALA